MTNYVQHTQVGTGTNTWEGIGRGRVPLGDVIFVGIKKKQYVFFVTLINRRADHTLRKTAPFARYPWGFRYSCPGWGLY